MSELQRIEPLMWGQADYQYTAKIVPGRPDNGIDVVELNRVWISRDEAYQLRDWLNKALGSQEGRDE